MPELKKAKEPFIFCTRLNLSELTGLKAATLEQLLSLIREVSGSCIYHHTHRFLQQHQYLSPEPPNDFAYWVAQVLGEGELAEQLASIDTVQFTHIKDLRENIVMTIENYLKENPSAKLRFAGEEEEFHFVKSISFVLPTPYRAYDLKEFADALNKVTFDSIYFHIFEARLRLGKNSNDFSRWFEQALGEKRLADDILKLDPYTYTLDKLRNTLIRLIERKIPK